MGRRTLISVVDVNDALPEPIAGIMLVRAWSNEGQVVARLQSSRLGTDDHSVTVVAGVEEISEMLTQWLRDMAETSS